MLLVTAVETAAGVVVAVGAASAGDEVVAGTAVVVVVVFLVEAPDGVESWKQALVGQVDGQGLEAWSNWVGQTSEHGVWLAVVMTFLAHYHWQDPAHCSYACLTACECLDFLWLL